MSTSALNVLMATTISPTNKILGQRRMLKTRTHYYKMLFILTITSHGGYNNYTYEDLFYFLHRKGNLNLKKITSRAILLDIVKIKYGGDKWDEEYEKCSKVKY